MISNFSRLWDLLTKHFLYSAASVSVHTYTIFYMSVRNLQCCPNCKEKEMSMRGMRFRLVAIAYSWILGTDKTAREAQVFGFSFLQM